MLLLLKRNILLAFCIHFSSKKHSSQVINWTPDSIRNNPYPKDLYDHKTQQSAKDLGLLCFVLRDPKPLLDLRPHTHC